MVYGNGWQNNWYPMTQTPVNAQIPNQSVGMQNQNANLVNANMNMPNMSGQYQDSIQNGGFVPVSNIEVARNYHVAPGMSVTFIDENAPYVYTKKRGLSQLDQPIFEKYKLVKEDGSDDVHQDKNIEETHNYVTKEEFDVVTGEITSLKEEVSKLSKRNKK